MGNKQQQKWNISAPDKGSSLHQKCVAYMYMTVIMSPVLGFLDIKQTLVQHLMFPVLLVG